MKYRPIKQVAVNSFEYPKTIGDSGETDDQKILSRQIHVAAVFDRHYHNLPNLVSTSMVHSGFLRMRTKK